MGQRDRAVSHSSHAAAAAGDAALWRYYEAGWGHAAAGGYHLRRQPVSGLVRGWSESRIIWRPLWPFYGTGQAGKGDAKCRQITRPGRYPYSAPIYGMGKWCDTFLTEKVRRKIERTVKKILAELMTRWVE